MASKQPSPRARHASRATEAARTQRRGPPDDAPSSTNLVMDRLIDPAAGADEQIEVAERAARVRRVLQLLPEGPRSALAALPHGGALVSGDRRASRGAARHRRDVGHTWAQGDGRSARGRRERGRATAQRRRKVMTNRTKEDFLPDDLVWAAGGHASDVVLTAMADGQVDIVPPTVLAHVDGCRACTTHLGNAALLSLHAGREMALLPRPPNADAPRRSPLVSPSLASRSSSVSRSRCSASCPSLLDAPSELGSAKTFAREAPDVRERPRHARSPSPRARQPRRASPSPTAPPPSSSSWLLLSCDCSRRRKYLDEPARPALPPRSRRPRRVPRHARARRPARRRRRGAPRRCAGPRRTRR